MTNKRYSEAEFSAQLDQDRSWRLREISDLKTAIRRADESLQRVLLRALITICYAHWEGHVRFAARKYLEYVARRKFSYSDLDRQFLRNEFLLKLAALSTSRKSIKERCALIDEILDSSDGRFSRLDERLIQTRSNLNFNVFTDICLVCGVKAENFADKETFIDKMLLQRRNSIAHGENQFVGISDLDKLTNETIDMMRAFADALENHVYLRDYKAA